MRGEITRCLRSVCLLLAFFSSSSGNQATRGPLKVRPPNANLSNLLGLSMYRNSYQNCFMKGKDGQSCVHPYVCNAFTANAIKYAECLHFFSCQKNEEPSDRSLGGGIEDARLLELLEVWAKNLFKSTHELIEERKDEGLVEREDTTEELPASTTNLPPFAKIRKPGDKIVESLDKGNSRVLYKSTGCCPSINFYVANQTLVNIYKEEKKIVHFTGLNPPKYQFIPHGLCAEHGKFEQFTCKQGTVPMSLLVYDHSLNPPLAFDTFYIPAFCNCV